MRPGLWALIFVAVLLLSKPGVDVSPSHTPMLALVMGGLALVVSGLVAITRTTPDKKRPLMITKRTCTILIAVLSLTAPLLHAQDLGRHRDMSLGSNVVAVAGAHGLKSTDVKTVHGRPALIQNLEWRSRRFLSASTATDDPLNDITFSFYNDQLFRIVANYDRSRTEGLTDTDLIDAMTTAYGAPQTLRPVRTAKRSPQSPQNAFADEEQVIARWEDAESAITLLRTRYPAAVSLVVLSKRLAGLAQSAEVEAARLDRLEAPGRETARLQQEADEARVSGEKARPANKAIFKP
jgi:hypothetical protein